MQLLQFFGSVPNKYQRFSSYYKRYDLYSAKKWATAFYTYFNSVMLSGMRKFPTHQHESWCPTWGLKLSHCDPCPGVPDRVWAVHMKWWAALAHGETSQIPLRGLCLRRSKRISWWLHRTVLLFPQFLCIIQDRQSSWLSLNRLTLQELQKPPGVSSIRVELEVWKTQASGSWHKFQGRREAWGTHFFCSPQTYLGTGTLSQLWEPRSGVQFLNQILRICFHVTSFHLLSVLSTLPKT